MKIVIIGSSTGGPYILEQIFAKFPQTPICIIIIQHLPSSFTNAFRGHIEALTLMKVRVPVQGEQLTEQVIFIAPAGRHMILERNRTIHFDDGEKLHGVKPSIDKTMLSLEKRYEDHLAGIILTGMGQDGAAGIAHIKDLGGLTIVQDLTTAPIKSMPQSALDTRKVTEILTPSGITHALIQFGKV